jgi:hypothetical protein
MYGVGFLVLVRIRLARGNSTAKSRGVIGKGRFCWSCVRAVRRY